MWDGGAHMGWMWFAGPLGFLLLIGLFGMWMMSMSAPRDGGRRGDDRADDPEQILKRRLAAGEIDEDEYRAKLDELRR